MDRPGVVRVFCDIHSHMNAFVLVFAHPFFDVTEPDGRYALANVPPGSYTVVGWHEGEPLVERAVTVSSGSWVELDLSVPLMRPLRSLSNRIFLASLLLAALSIGAAMFFVRVRLTTETQAAIDRDLADGCRTRGPAAGRAVRDIHALGTPAGRPAPVQGRRRHRRRPDGAADRRTVPAAVGRRRAAGARSPGRAARLGRPRRARRPARSGSADSCGSGSPRRAVAGIRPRRKAGDRARRHHRGRNRVCRRGAGAGVNARSRGPGGAERRQRRPAADVDDRGRRLRHAGPPAAPRERGPAGHSHRPPLALGADADLERHSDLPRRPG